MKSYDICVAWVDPVEKAFVTELKRQAERKNLSVYEISFSNLVESITATQKGEIKCRLYIDRASIDNTIFFSLMEKMKTNGAKVVNDPDSVINWSSKERLIEMLRKNDIPLPHVFSVDPNNTPDHDIKKMIKKTGSPFAIKPSYSGGAEELSLRARTVEDFRTFVEDNYVDSYLIQEYVLPTIKQKKTAWFRFGYSMGEILQMWWDPLSHVYIEFSDSDFEKEVGRQLTKYLKVISQKTGLELFTSEYAMRTNGELVCVDYANHPMDLNPLSNTDDGMPDSLLKEIVSSIIESQK